MEDTPGIKTIVVGHDESARFLAFGDDSQFMNTLVYAFAIVDRANNKRAEKECVRSRTSSEYHQRFLSIAGFFFERSRGKNTDSPT
jgi:hypothetical protein